MADKHVSRFIQACCCCPRLWTRVPGHTAPGLESGQRDHVATMGGGRSCRGSFAVPHNAEGADQGFHKALPGGGEVPPWRWMCRRASTVGSPVSLLSFQRRLVPCPASAGVTCALPGLQSQPGWFSAPVKTRTALICLLIKQLGSTLLIPPASRLGPRDNTGRVFYHQHRELPPPRARCRCTGASPAVE